MKTNEIKTKNQVRKDMGDLTELKNSIRENGILQPLLVDKDNNLIAGHRRLAAAKEMELKEVPVQVIDITNGDRVAIIQLVENLHRKDLDPIEEANAYDDYMTKNKITIEQLSQMIGKTKEYIRRRMNLKNLVPEAIKALKEKKIELGHALLLNQMKKNLQKDSMEFIIDHDLTVQNFADQIRWMGTVDFMDIEFRQEETDGSKQKTLLEEIGKELEPKHLMDDNLKENNKFKAELGKYVESQRKILRDKGITVFNSEEELKAKHPEAYQLRLYNTAVYNRAVKSLPNSNKNAVVIDLDGYGGMDKTVFSLIAKKEEKAETKKQAKSEVTEEDRAEADKIMESTRKEKLKQRAQEYTRKHEENINMELLKKDTKVHKAIQTLFNAHKSGNYNYDLKTLMEQTPAELDKESFELMTRYIKEIGQDDMKTVSKETGLDWSKHWTIDEEFLELHTKEQLIDLAKELKLGKDFIEASKNVKKGELIEEFMDQDLNKKVPKIVGKAK